MPPHPLVRRATRSVADFSLALALALALLLLNIAINFSEEIHQFFQGYAQFRLTSILVNGLIVWLAVMFWLAFRRWRRTERDHQEAERILGDVVPSALLVVAADQEIVMCNRSAERMFGYTEQEVLHRKTDLLYGELRRQDEPRPPSGDALGRQGFLIAEATGKRKDGSTVPLEIISGELSGKAGAVLLLSDVSERQRAEDACRKLQERVRRQPKMESVGVLAGGIAHDFNDLLTGIIGNAELALQHLPTGDADSRESISEILRAGRRAADICRNVLSHAGRERPRMDPLDLSAVVQSVAHVVEVSVSKRHKLNYDLARNLPVIKGNSAQLQQLLLHLALNASEAIGPEIGVIVIATGVKDCDAACLARTHADEPPSPGRYVFLRVADSGCGMDAATQARLFEPFFTTKRARHGRGLAGIRGIACEHRGTVAIESEEGRGSSFTVLFPALQQPAAPPTALPGGNDGREPQAAESPAWLGQRTILVIEDEEHIRSFLRTALMSLGFNVLLAADGNEGLRLFRERQRDIRLTLLDLTMPPPNGETTLREIRRIDPRAAVVLCSGQDPAGLPENIRGECFLPKPCQMSALEATVRVALATAAETGS